MKIFLALALSTITLCHAETTTPHPPKQKWSFQGAFGTFKRDELQRGFQVYKEVCSACHSLKRIRFRDLKSLGFNEAEIKAIAAGYEVKDGPNADGEMFQRKALPSDAIPSPFPNDNAARAANNGALPPDLSLIVKAREGGADYVHALMNGYTAPPAGIVIEGGRHYNQYFPDGQISMAKPLTDGQVTYADGTEATVDQMSRDVTTFLAWAAEPEAEQRKQMGVKVIAYLLFMTVIFYFTMRRIWKGVR
ncbi:MAG: cytochrome c1 [Alphaproteobacteria bacterium]|nr:cytochrome c1 [Alphaproteobacteria bacterium]